MGPGRADREEVNHGYRPGRGGLVGALVDGGATFAGTIIGNTQRARHEREIRRIDQEAAYSNAMRSLLRTANRRQLLGDQPDTTVAMAWFDDLIDAQYWVTVLLTACGPRQRDAVDEARELLASQIEDATRGGIYAKGPSQRALDAYALITRAAAKDRA